MSKLFLEIFDKERVTVFKKLADFSQAGVLGGGTALALQLKHRYSYDFDIFSARPLSPKLLLKVRQLFGPRIQKMVDSSNELGFMTRSKVKISFVYFPFSPLYPLVQSNSLPLFSLADLAANKAYVIGRRGEYRDYVDLFFLLKQGLKLEKVIHEAAKKFGGAFSERLFLEQLVYFEELKDLRIDFLKKKYNPKQVLQFLKKEVSRFGLKG